MRDLVAKLKRTVADDSRTLDEDRTRLLQAEHALERAEAELEAVVLDPVAYESAEAAIAKPRKETERLRRALRQREQTLAQTTQEFEEAQHGQAIADARAELARSYRRRAEISEAFAKAITVANRTSAALHNARDAVREAEQALVALGPEDDEWPDSLDEPGWPAVDADALAAFIAGGPVQPSVTAARTKRDRERQDEQLIAWAVKNALALPATTSDGREAIEAAISSVRDDLQVETRWRYEAERAKNRGKLALGIGAARETNPTR
jgi:hypothetical protein